TGTKDRTYYQTAGLSGKDFVYFAGLASVAAGILLTF
ncbi:energy-coupling factor transporter transmembrane protein EcfT, partial [Bacillaceae bacterium HSR45]|nr:energy-coupling factor transporter transmembrane protein EcfT [Bacillaceae bacterium HSR45]